MGTAIFYHKMSQEGSILKKFTSAFGRLFLSAVLILFYTMMPAINLHDQDFIVFLIICILIVLAVNFMESILIFLKTVQQNRGVEIVRDPVTGRMVLRRKYADASGSPFAGFKATPVQIWHDRDRCPDLLFPDRLGGGRPAF